MLRTSAPLIGALDFIIAAVPLFKDLQSWKLQTQELAFRDPFSEDTHRIRRKATFFAFLAILAHYYPVDLQESHVLGIQFARGFAPPLKGLVGLLVVFFAIELLIYSAQEIVSWVTQARDSYFSQMTTKLQNVTEKNHELETVVEKTRGWLETVANTIDENPQIEGVDPNGQTELAALKRKLQADSQTAGKWVSDLEGYVRQYQARTEEAAMYLAEIKSGVGSAIRFQLLRVGLAQLVFPAIIITWAIVKSADAAASLLVDIVQ